MRAFVNRLYKKIEKNQQFSRFFYAILDERFILGIQIVEESLNLFQAVAFFR